MQRDATTVQGAGAERPGAVHLFKDGAQVSLCQHHGEAAIDAVTPAIDYVIALDVEHH
jgi:hypothetical protein